MKILTYNVHGWQTPDGGPNVEQIAEVIAGAGADLVGLNEVFHPAPAAAPAAAGALPWLAERLGMSYAFAATQAADPAPRHPPYGNALLSRWPIVAHAAHHLSPAASYGKRGLLEARVRLPAGPALTIYVTHLDHRSEELRLGQWTSALTWLARDRDRLHLVLGDFNALAATDYAAPGAVDRLAAYQAARGWPIAAFDVIGRVLAAGYADAYAAAAGRAAAGATLPAADPERRIDYIFLPAPFVSALRGCAPVRSPLTARASDHLPVLAEIDG